MNKIIAILVACYLGTMSTQIHAVDIGTGINILGGDAFAPLVSSDPRCLELKIVGSCRFGRVKIKHWLPVAFIEVVTSKGGSIFAPALNPLAGTRFYGDEQAYEVNIWEVPGARRVLEQRVGCSLCGPKKSSASGSVPELITSAQQVTGGLCGAGDAVLQGLVTNTLNAISLKKVKLLYSSEVDQLNWATGCRDIPIATALGPAVPLACSAQGIGRNIDSLLGTNVTSLLPGSDVCVGSWGGLYPRQMKTDSTEIVGAAHAAYRALHIARYNTRTFPFPVNLNQKLQFAFPTISTCFRPGDSLLDVENLTTVSPNGNYGFFIWQKVSCCKSLGSVAACRGGLGGIAGGALGGAIEGAAIGAITGGPAGAAAGALQGGALGGASEATGISLP